jgi:RND superfamily putative drug exporter
VRATVRAITAGATITFCAFAAFGAFDDRAPQIIGVGPTVAVLVDATIVRPLPMPATMEALGERDRWFPRLSPARLPIPRNVS